MSTESRHFTPPHIAKPIDPVLRFGMEMNYGTLYVVLCGGFPTLMAHLCYQENVDVFTVRTVGELRELLAGADGIPADLAIVYSDTMQGLPPLTFRSPVDGHESTVIFTLDPMIGDGERFSGIDALASQLLEKKEQFVKGYSEYSRNHPGVKEETRE